MHKIEGLEMHKIEDKMHKIEGPEMHKIEGLEKLKALKN